MLRKFQRDFAAKIIAPVEGPMRVYRNTFINGCTEALRANYPIIEQLLGNEMFAVIAAEFALDCPPRRPVLALYGEEFPDWLEEQSWVHQVSYAPHVARIERLYIEALFAADIEPIGMADLAGYDDWQALHLELHPAARFDWLTTPAFSIWLAHCNGQEGELELEWNAEGVLITRPRLEVRAARLERAGHRFLFGIRHGDSVGAAAIAVASLFPQTDVGSLFTALVNAGVFATTCRS